MVIGRMTVNMEAVKEIVSKPADPRAKEVDEFDREPFEHPKLAPVDNLNVQDPRDIVGKDKLSALASSVGMADVLRWKPRLVCCCPKMNNYPFFFLTVANLLAARPLGG